MLTQCDVLKLTLQEFDNVRLNSLVYTIAPIIIIMCVCKVALVTNICIPTYTTYTCSAHMSLSSYTTQYKHLSAECTCFLFYFYFLSDIFTEVLREQKLRRRRRIHDACKIQIYV